MLELQQDHLILIKKQCLVHTDKWVVKVCKVFVHKLYLMHLCHMGCFCFTSSQDNLVKYYEPFQLFNYNQF